MKQRHLLAACLALTCINAAPAAEIYPARPIRLIIGVPPGGAADFTGRLVAGKLVDALGQNVVVENRGGAGGTIATDIVAKATPDGYTLLLSSSSTHGVGPVVYRNLPYDPFKDFTHIVMINDIPAIMVVHQSIAAKSVKEFVALAKSKAGGYLFASSSSGSGPHLMGELFKLVTGAPIAHVPYKGSGPAVLDLAAGQVHVMFDGPPSLIGQVKAGKLRPLAALSDKRSILLPDLPTMVEVGYPDIKGGVWYGLSGPAGLPAPVSERLRKEVSRIVLLDEIKEKFATGGAIPMPLGPKEYTQFIRAENKKWGEVVRVSGATAD